MSMSDEGTGVMRTPAPQAPRGNAESTKRGDSHTNGLAGREPGNGEAGKPLPGLAAFGKMQAYVPVAQPIAPAAAETADEDAASEAAWRQPPDFEGEEPESLEGPDPADDMFADTEPDDAPEPNGHYTGPRFDTDYTFQPVSMDTAEAWPQEASIADEAEAQAAQSLHDTAYQDQGYQEHPYAEQAHEDQAYAEQLEAGPYPGEDFPPENLQQYESGQQATEAEDFLHQPEHDAAADAGFDADGGRADRTGALQAFEAHYDQHPEIALGGFDEFREEAGAQPFFHEAGQEDADFLGAAEEEIPPPKARKSRKALMFGSGLLGALALGGALAFAYKTGAITQVVDTGNPPLIQADRTPVKVAPAEPGGKKFPHKNKQIYDRLQGDQKPEVEKLVSREEPVMKPAQAQAQQPARVPPQAQPAPAPQQPAKAPQQPQQQIAAVDADKVNPETPGTPHKVKTLQIRPDGTIVATQDQPAAAIAQPTPPPPSGDPGIAVVVPETPAAPVTTAAVPKTPPPPPAEPAPQAKPEQPEPAAPQEQAAVQPTAPLPNPKPRPAATEPAPAAIEGNGNFVVQVASRRSQAMALAAFADLQQKYTKLLGDYQPLIQSADLGNKGVWYRLRVGPMEKKADAEELCKRLKGAGLRSCLVRPL